MKRSSLIKKHLLGKLSNEEKVVFDELLKTDPNFKKELKFHSNLKDVIRLEERKSIKKQLQNLEFSDKRRNLFKWTIAASIGLLIAFGGFNLYKKKSFSNQELFAQNFNPAANTLHPIVRGEDSLSKIEKAFVYYENGDFQQFLLIINSTSYSNPDYDFFIANAYLAIGNASEAIPILKKYLSSTNINFKDNAHWYLGLAYLNEKQPVLAKAQFELLNNKSDYNYTKAKEILQKIK
jgi:hypothetical protein